MQAVKAFVGHSFSKEDKDVVHIFLEHFRNLANAYPSFSWDHAEEAEPLPLSDKILAKVEGKNVFIGICTRNELVGREASFIKSFFRNDLLKAKTKDLQWKASDWIIQEIGMAVGRKMSLIILIEEGVRPPGGLYGNLEYIQFSRANPHACFDKILQMLVSLNPKDTTDLEVAYKEKDIESDVSEPKADDNDVVPQADWTKNKYQSAVFRMIIGGNQSAADKITEAFISSPFAQGDEADEWYSHVEYLRLMFGTNADFEKIKKLAESKPENSKLSLYLARAYAELGEPMKAVDAFIHAASVATNDDDWAANKGGAAIQCLIGGSAARALEIVQEMKLRAVVNPALYPTMLWTFRDVAQKMKDDEYEVAVLEEMVAMKPADTSLRFQLAHKHSQTNNREMAFYHYMKIPVMQRDSATWNNLGVSFENLNMPAKSVGAYLRSEQDGETLAMANIGFKLLRAGFLEEAKGRAQAAIKVDDYNQNINDLLKRLREMPEEEEKKQADALSKVQKQADFYRLLGVASLKPRPERVAPHWDSPDGVLTAILVGDEVTFEGTQLRDQNALVGLLAGGARTKVLHRTKIVARLRGAMLVGEIKRSRDGEMPSLAAGVFDMKVKVEMCLHQNSISVMESHGSGEPRFYEMNLTPEAKLEKRP